MASARSSPGLLPRQPENELHKLKPPRNHDWVVIRRPINYLSLEFCPRFQGCLTVTKELER